MKKRLVAILLIIFVLMITGCGNSNNAEEPAGADSQITENQTTENGDISAEDTEDILPSEETVFFTQKSNVNLAEGESNNRIVVDQNIQKMEVSLTVYLEDSTFQTVKYPMHTEMDYTIFETAYLQYDNKESIVLEIVNGTSNYGAAEYHVLHVEKDSQGFEIVEDATILGEQPLTGDRYVYSLVGFVGNVSMISAEDLITTVYGKPAVRFVDWDGGKKEGETYYLYYDQEWKVEDGDIGALLIKAVLLGDAQFIYVSDGKTKIIDITDIPMLFGADDASMKIWDFAVVDLDRDGEDEVILFVVGVAGDMGGKLILHQIDGKVYGYICDNRTLEELKTDGTFGFSDPTGVAEGGIGGIIDFSEFGYTMDKISYGSGTHEGWDTFIVDHEPATEEEYFDAANKQSEKPDAEWYGFTNENINAVF